jgi:Mg-chelatase subunit ChlD
MAADGGTPPEPLESAKRAAADFVRLTRTTDQIGYFSYATLPSNPIEQTLSTQKNEVAQAVMSTQMGTDGIQYTDMGAAFATAGAELLSERARDDARKVIIFLTDGDVTRPLNPATGARDVEYAANVARTEAARVKEAGITVYTIGFGDFFANVTDVERDVSLIRDLASTPDQSYLAPTITELQTVYREIAEDICEVGPARIDVIPRLDGNFVPYP